MARSMARSPRLKSKTISAALPLMMVAISGAASNRIGEKKGPDLGG
jgi:hypothetical protein